MNPYRAIFDDTRLRGIETADHIAAMRSNPKLAHMAPQAEFRLAYLRSAAQVLRAVRDAHERDPEALRAVLGDPLNLQTQAQDEAACAGPK
jgi:hypothetical protein